MRCFLEERELNWIETPITKFGSKCIMSKHDFCVDTSCECICHRATFELKKQDDEKN